MVAQHADNAGAAMLRGVTNFFDECDVRYVSWPKGCKDANDVLLVHGQEAVVQATNGAKQVDPPGGLITGSPTCHRGRSGKSGAWTIPSSIGYGVPLARDLPDDRDTERRQDNLRHLGCASLGARKRHSRMPRSL